MPAPEDLLKSLTGHPAVLDQTLGCMTRIFHIFEGHPAFMGRRSSSTRIAIDSGHSQLRTQRASHSNRHDRRNPTSTVEDKPKKTVQPTSQHHKSYSDISDLAATPSRTFTEFRTPNSDTEAKPACSEGTRPAYSEGTRPTFSEGTVDALAFYNYETLRAAAIFAGDPRQSSDLDHREYSKRSLTSPKRVSKARQVRSDHTQQSSSSEIRDALLATFDERHKAKNSDQDLKKEAGSRKAANLPRSHSVYARGLEPSELLHWKDGLRSSASPPRRFTREAKGNKSPSRSSGNTRLISHHSSPERRVEPKCKDRGRSLSRDYPPGSRGPKKLSGETLGKESPGASDFRESLRPFLAGPIVPARENFASRSTDSSCGQNLDSRDTSVNVIARLMGLEEIPSITHHASSKVVPDAKSRGDNFFRGLVQFDPQTMRASSPPPPPPPCQSNKHHLGLPYKQENNRLQEEDQYQENYPAQYNMEQGLCCCEEDRDYEYLQISRRPFLSFEDDCKEATGKLGCDKDALPPKLADAFQAEDAKHDAPEIFPLLMKQPNHKKKMIWKILEAMRPKLLLKISRRKQAEPEMLPLTNYVVQPIQETQQQTTRVSFGSKLSSETDGYSNLIKEVQVQEHQTESSNSTESSIVKPCIDETSVAVDKPVDKIVLSNARSQISNADIFQVRQVETASSNSNDVEMCPTRRETQINNEDFNMAHDQRKPIKSEVFVENAPRSAHTEGTLESDCETDPSSTTQHDKSDNVRESRKVRTTSRRPNPSSRSPTPDIQRKHGRASSPEARPSLSTGSPSKDHIRGAGTVGRKSLVANGKKDGRPAASHPKAQLVREEILTRRMSERRVNDSPIASKLRGSSLDSEKSAGKETFSTRTAGAKASSPGAVRLKQSNEGAECRGAPLTPPKIVDSGRPTTTKPVTPDAPSSSNSDVQLQPVSAQSQPSIPEPVMVHPVAVQGPKLGAFKEPHVCQLLELQSEVEMIEVVSAGDPCEGTAQPSNSGACGSISDEPQPLIQVQGESIEASEELTTPRGVLLNYKKLDDKLAEAVDRPSPVSVLDTTPFDEDLMLSPTSSSKHNVMPMQDADSVAIHNDEAHENCPKDLEAYQDTASATVEVDLDVDELFNTCAEGLQAQVEIYTETENGINKFQSYFKDAEPDEEQTFVEICSSPKITTCCESHDNIVMNACVSDKSKTKQQSSFETAGTGTINESLLQSLQSNGILQENDHVLLLDCLEEIMERILESQSDLMLWVGLPPESICEIPKGKQLEQELWNEMQNMKRSSFSEDICDTVHNLLLKNLLRCQGRQWSTFNTDREKIGLDMETMIVGDLIEEAVGDLCALPCHESRESPPLETARRQLFTN